MFRDRCGQFIDPVDRLLVGLLVLKRCWSWS
jgi:hypothetical protein